ncbi:MAG TPA: biotin/lipoyl-containing protein, partial [Rhizobium sp.]|nr:biotin/lipoyl-containing protein [Rhizobium sp.]
MGTFHMPSLGADMEAGTLVEWLVKPGAAVRHGDVIAVVETQKGAIEIEVFEDGIFETSLAAIGDRLPVGAPMAVIARPGGVALEAPAPPVSVTAVETTATAVPPPPIPQAVPVVPAEPEVAVRILVTPAARRLAEQSGVALAELHGSGPRGEIVLADVKARKGREDTSRPAEATATGQVMTGMRAAIAAAMARSKREIPHYYLSHTAELAKAET